MTRSGSFVNNPGLDTWLEIHADGRITVNTGKVEFGQKLTTAFAVIAAEELDVDLERIILRAADTAVSPAEGYTSGSMSMETSGTAIRQAAAAARRIMLGMAAEKLGAAVETLSVTDGDIGDGKSNQHVTYWDLMGGKRFDCAVPDDVTPKNPDQYRLIGHPVEGDGFEALVSGSMMFVHDMDLPDMVHARVVRPPHSLARLQDLDEAPVRAMTGVIAVVRDGSFLAVVCEREEQAVWAAARLAEAAVWDESKELNSTDIFEQLKKNPRESFPLADGVPQDLPVPPLSPPENAAATISATYQRPYIMHASIGPSAAMALFDADGLNVWSHTQGVYPLRQALATVMDLPEDAIRVRHVPGAGCYGHNGADDVVLDAALAARAVPGRPVLLKWERADENAWEPYGPAMQMDMQGSLSDAGKILHWSGETYSDTHMGRPADHGNHSRLLAAWHMDPPRTAPTAQAAMGFHAGIHRNADPIYDFPDRRLIKHLVRGLPLRTSALRGLGAYANVFAIESFMDELAHECGADPLEFRLKHLSDERARAVLEAAAEKADWGSGNHGDGPGLGHGRGLALARYKNVKCYAAVVIDLDVDEFGAIKLERAVIAADAGQIVDPDGLKSQLEGGLIQSASWTLKEQVDFNGGGILSCDWESYPILTFPEVPTIETVLIDRPDQPFLGAGEATQGPTAAAIGNAVFNAVGLRLRRTPFNQDRVREAAAEG
ncbi:MAG: molybdopterin-dependent oxidoreductase [Proteobacteria bacterium]|nr:molybdopterin-dependent oxidoreductase [Pseudomonadota bacterium]